MPRSPNSRMSLLALCSSTTLALLSVPVPAAAGPLSDRSDLLAQAAGPDQPPAAQPPAPAVAPPPPAAAPAPTSKPAAPEGTPAVVVDGQQVESILGKKVKSGNGDDMGRIVDIIADKTGQVRAAIIDFGGLLGVGSRQIAVDWRAIRFLVDGKSDSVVVDLSRDQLRVAPVYKAGEQIVVLGKPPAGDASAAPPTAPAKETVDAAKPAVPQ